MKLVDDLRAIESKNQIESENRFEELITKLDIKDETLKDFVFDYIYNCPDCSGKYLNYIKTQIYGDA